MDVLSPPSPPGPGGAAGADTRNQRAVRKAAEEFEAQFLSQMLSQMYEGIETDGPFGGGSGEAMFRTLLLDEYGKQIAKAGGLGIADAVQKTMLDLQEV